MTDVIIDKDAQNNGLVDMISNLIIQNMSNHPERRKSLKAMEGNIVIVAKDIDVSVTLECRKGSIIAYDGVKEPYKLKIETDSDSILKLSALKIKAGLPYYFDKTGREVLGMIFKGKLKIKGLFTHPVLLTRVTKLFSVY